MTDAVMRPRWRMSPAHSLRATVTNFSIVSASLLVGALFPFFSALVTRGMFRAQSRFEFRAFLYFFSRFAFSP